MSVLLDREIKLLVDRPIDLLECDPSFRNVKPKDILWLTSLIIVISVSLFIFSHTNMQRAGQRQRFPCHQCDHTFSTRYKVRFREKNIHLHIGCSISTESRSKILIEVWDPFVASNLTQIFSSQLMDIHHMYKKNYVGLSKTNTERITKNVFEHYRLHVDQHFNRFYTKG